MYENSVYLKNWNHTRMIPLLSFNSNAIANIDDNVIFPSMLQLYVYTHNVECENVWLYWLYIP